MQSFTLLPGFPHYVRHLRHYDRQYSNNFSMDILLTRSSLISCYVQLLRRQFQSKDQMPALAVWRDGRCVVAVLV